ncbi:alpha/beta fold hydrolase [Luteimonas wenzhouensis]|uniref:Alpha/beta hydrolase n=1 Tax=Luteimonas wenzhouensis TaxID=2599615 RepID=A0A5C5TX56_9GAMM|nr:alpha/beta hydrolase [Luteimonas wenzhouensis]TWT18743.1 alpha/beta hydrolase [Luteimonas wenzhouensis]
MESNERFVAVEGGRLFVRHWRPQRRDACAPPLLLLHDSLGSVAQWRDFPARLATASRRDVIAYDRLGFGRSTPRAARHSLDFIDEEARGGLPALLAGLGLERYALLGHSVGGGMALTAAAFDPERCAGVVSMSAQAFVEQRTVEGVRRTQQEFARPGGLGKLAFWHGARAAWVLDAWTGTWLDPAFAGWSLDAVLPRVRCPVLALHGDRDEYGSEAFPRRIAEGVGGPARMVVLEDCGHMPHREHPERVLAEVVAFLAEVA